MIINSTNSPDSVFERHFTLKCPKCGNTSNVSAISIPRFEYLRRFQPDRIGIAYRCDSCNEPVFLTFKVYSYSQVGNGQITVSDDYKEVERPQETFEFKYLPEKVEKDFREALICYSNSCFNAFAAMCRRCVQSSSDELGAKGKDKVLNQIRDLKDMAQIDEETFEVLKQIIISGHDGAHPHLPELSPERASVLLELMKDVMYQLFVRKAKIQESMQLRTEAVASKTSE